MTDRDPRTLHDDLDLLTAHAPVELSPPADILGRVATRRRRTVALRTAAGAAVAVATVVVLALVTASPSSPPGEPDVSTPSPTTMPSPTATASAEATPETVPDSVAFDYDAACPPESRRSGTCPIDEVGQQKWEEIVEAFGGQLDPYFLVGSARPDGTRSYMFQARIGTQPVAQPPRWPGAEPRAAARVEISFMITVPATPSTTQPSAVLHPTTPSDFRWGWGLVLITQADGTVIDLRFGDAKNASDPLEAGELDVVALVERGIAELCTCELEAAR